MLSPRANTPFSKTILFCQLIDWASRSRKAETMTIDPSTEAIRYRGARSRIVVRKYTKPAACAANPKTSMWATICHWVGLYVSRFSRFIDYYPFINTLFTIEKFLKTK
jgi:hypothetical protein